MDPPTILALKQAFLERTTRQLSQPLAPSSAWRRKNDLRGSDRGGAAAAAAEHDRLPPRAVDDALVRANQLLQQHVRRVYAPPALRHVAEQLDQLYHDEPIGRNDGVTDYSSAETIKDLLPAWEDAAEAEALPLEARRYTDLVEQLQSLSAQRTEVHARVQRLRDMALLLGGLGGTAEAPTVQDNLVTRDGPVERELERMRLLLVRVGDKVANLPERPYQAHQTPVGMDVDDADVMDVEVVGQKRVRALLEQY
ncbi:kinetochore protein [Ophiostoma piceae UAMH 11346]|uniref:Kinetochore protein n=1 Tax=Ophiostoma piceae (strain UAMH 11346) TaxID=1262450 RepID=S3D0B0_OPHP1|nr:kinetochore protein [Ophiostoma piceae UAMH 11346]